MDPKWKSHLPPVYSQLVDGVRVSGSLLDNLVESRLLTLPELSEVKQVLPNTEEYKARQMLELLCKKPPGSFDRFCSVLERVGYGHLAVILQSGGAGLLQNGMYKYTIFHFCLLSVFTYRWNCAGRPLCSGLEVSCTVLFQDILRRLFFILFEGDLV